MFILCDQAQLRFLSDWEVAQRDTCSLCTLVTGISIIKLFLFKDVNSSKHNSRNATCLSILFGLSCCRWHTVKENKQALAHVTDNSDCSSTRIIRWNIGDVQTMLRASFVSYSNFMRDRQYQDSITVTTCLVFHNVNAIRKSRKSHQLI